MHTHANVSPDRIFELGQAFWGSRALHSAVELGLFTLLASEGPLAAAALTERLGIHSRGARDFLDALVAIGMLQRDASHRYSNTAETNEFLDQRKPTYVGAFVELCAIHLYPRWEKLTDALRTGRPQSREALSGDALYAPPYDDPMHRDLFLRAMTSGSLPVAKAIATRFPWRDYTTVVDVGAAQGALLVEVARVHPNIRGSGYDLPAVQPSFERYVRTHGLHDRLAFVAGDFLHDPLPTADVLVLGRVLHNWDLDTKKRVLAKAYAALPHGGTLLVYERLIDADRRTNAAGLLASLNMLIVTPAGFDFTDADCVEWMQEAGFHNVRTEPLVLSHGMVIGTK